MVASSKTMDHGDVSTRPRTGFDYPATSNPFDVLADGEEAEVLKPKFSQQEAQVKGNGKQESNKSVPSSSISKPSVDKEVNDSRILVPSLSTGDQGMVFDSDSDEDEVFLKEDEMNKYMSSTGGGQLLEEDDLNFYDGYEAQVYDLPGKMLAFCNQFDIRLNNCARSHRLNGTDGDNEKWGWVTFLPRKKLQSLISFKPPIVGASLYDDTLQLTFSLQKPEILMIPQAGRIFINDTVYRLPISAPYLR
ncbi:hypothetical protein Tco_0139064 [Tanacetum coccineum]